MKVVGYKPCPHQRDVHKAIAEHPKGSVFVVKSQRQVGKTIMLENELLRASLNNRDAISMAISLTLAASRKIYKEMLKAIQKTPVLNKKNDSLLMLEFINGSVIYFRSVEQGDSLRGFSIKNGGIMVIDEAAYCPDEFFYSVLLPMTNVSRADIVIASTPKFKTGFFFTYFERGLNGDPGIYSFDFTTYDLTAFLSPEKLEEYRRVMPKNQFITEYLGQFLDGDSVLFEGFRECIAKAKASLSRVYIGVDWCSGVGKDRTAVSVINQAGEQIFTAQFNDKNTSQTVDEVEKIYNKYKALNPIIWGEVNGVGKPYCDLLKDRDIKVYEWTTTNKSKNELVAHLQVAFEQHKLTLADDERQSSELSYYEADYNPKTMVVTYSAPQGLNDDTVMSLMISWEAYLYGNKVGKYVVGAA